MTTEIRDKVLNIVAQQVNQDVSSLNTDLKLDDLGISSLDAITIIYETEEEFDIEIPGESFVKLNTIQDIISGIEKLIKTKD